MTLTVSWEIGVTGDFSGIKEKVIGFCFHLQSTLYHQLE